MGNDFVRELNAIENAGYPLCEVWINTVGGSVVDGLEMYNAMVNSTIEVHTRNVGVAFSTGGWLMQAGKKRIANYYSKTMMHNTSGGDEKTLNAMNTTVSAMLSSRSKKSDEKIQEMMKDETWLTADEGKRAGLYDEIDMNCGADVKDSFENSQPFAAYNKMQMVVNKLIQEPSKNIKMKKVTNLLNLNEDATEDSIVKEVNSLKDQIKNLTQELADKEAAIKKAEDEKKAAEVDATAVTAIDNFIKEGRIDSSVREQYLALAKIDLEGTKNVISKLPIGRPANKLPIPTGPTTGGESRASWDYGKWEKEDAEGLINMYKNDTAAYDLLLNNWSKIKNIK